MFAARKNLVFDLLRRGIIVSHVGFVKADFSPQDFDQRAVAACLAIRLGLSGVRRLARS
jgi:hypothetical protein